jgi:signal transduction histidine kinase
MKNPLLILILILTTNNIFSQTIKVAVLNDISPISFINESNEPDGIFTDVINRIAALEGWEIKWVRGSWKENIEALKNNEIDLIVAMSKISERQEIFTFNKNNIITNWGAIYLPDNSEVSNILELENKTIGIMKNDVNGINFQKLMDEFDIKFSAIMVDDYSQIIELLENNEIDAGVFFSLYLANKNFNIKNSGIIFSPIKSYFAINKDSNNQYIIDTIDKYLVKWKKDKNSYYYYLYNKWFLFNLEEKSIIPNWLKYLFLLSGILIILSISFILSLKSLVNKKTNELKYLNLNLEKKVKETSEKLIDTEKIAMSAKLVSGIAHEINTPIGIGVTSISHLKEQLEINQEYFKKNKLTPENLLEFFSSTYQFYEIILNNLQQALNLITNFQQISSDNIAQSIRQINLKEYIEKIITSLTPETKRSNFVIGLDLENIIIKTYPDVFSHILINFIMNSKILAFNDDSILPHIKIILKKYDNYIKLIYEDNGNGIDEENIEKIYDPFFSTNKINGNTGLGLTIVYNLIKDKLNGSIKIESEINKYTKFIIKFPIKEE